MDDVYRSMRNLFNKRVLTHQEEIDFAIERDSGSETARNILIECNMKLVYSIALSYRRTRVELEDLVMAGVPGLAIAAERFKWQKGYRFSTYATWWIKRAIARYIYLNGRTITVPEHMHGALSQLATIAPEKTPCALDEEELARKIGATVTTLRSLREIVGSISIDQPAESASFTTLADILPSAKQSPEEIVVLRVDIERAMELLHSQSPNAHAVINLRYGLDGGDPLETLAEVGDMLGFTRERARQLHLRGIGILCQYL